MALIKDITSFMASYELSDSLIIRCFEVMRISKYSSPMIFYTVVILIPITFWSFSFIIDTIRIKSRKKTRRILEIEQMYQASKLRKQ